ncbi:MAG: hypothetical protein ACLFUZ_02205 [Candidatus Micrarchaeia archaeon]
MKRDPFRMKHSRPVLRRDIPEMGGHPILRRKKATQIFVRGMRGLSSRSPKKRFRSVDALHESAISLGNTSEALKKISTSLLSEKNIHVRKRMLMAIRMLAKTQEDCSYVVPALEEVILHGTSAERVEAARALRAVGDPGCIVCLNAAIEDEPIKKARQEMAETVRYFRSLEF